MTHPVRNTLLTVALFAAAAATAFLAHGLTTELDAGGGLDGTTSLNATLGGADLVVLAHVSDVGSLVVKQSGARHLPGTLAVDEVLYSAEIPSQRATAPEYRTPDIVTIGPLDVYEPVSEGSKAMLQFASEAGTQVLVTLGYWDRSMYSDTVAEWGVVNVATIGEAGDLTFIGPYGESSDEQLKVVSSSGAAVDAGVVGNDIATVVAWVDEKASHRSNLERSAGPLELAYLESVRRPTKDEVWATTDPSNRFVDPEFAPASLSESLVEGIVFLEIDTDAQIEGHYVTLQTDTGVVHRAHLMGGSHPASVWLTDSDTEVTVFAEFDEGVHVRIGSFKPTRIGDGSTPIVNIERSGASSVSLSVRSASDAELELTISLWQERLATKQTNDATATP